MTPERWRQITAIFHGVRDLDPARRPAMLDELCGGNVSLRAEVESLLSGHAAAMARGAGSVSIEVEPQLQPSASFGDYRIEALVGVGGMGQVYRATDLRLQRTVAIKVLPSILANDRDFATRFEREARVLATLNHPNIAGIYGLAESGGVKGLVLEYVEGTTLAELLAGARRQALGTRKALDIAKQIALALEAAHDKRIIHRDLKPANVKITPAGTVKVLDFGIAKVVDPLIGDTAGTGVVLGTAGYTSPEQARGLPADTRVDIWAFGCVLFEMLSGRGPFAAATPSDALAKVIEREPDWSALPANVAPAIRRLLGRCLQKDPANRFRHIADVRMDVEDASTVPVTRRVPVALGLGTLAALCVAGWFGYQALTSTDAPAASRPYMEIGITLPNNVLPVNGATLSPDGSFVAIGGASVATQIYVHSFLSAETTLLEDTANCYAPFWSPDSRTIGYFSTGRVLARPVTAGTATTIASFPPRATGSERLTGGSWSRSGIILVSTQERIYRIPASGGAPVEVPLNGIIGSPTAVQFLPDERHFVFFGHRRSRGVMQLASLDGDRVTEIVESDYPGRFAPPDRLLFVRDGSLLAQRLDMRRFVLTGTPDVIAEGVNRGTVTAVTSNALILSASENGTIAFAAPLGGSRGQLSWFARGGPAAESIPAPPGGVEYLNPMLSPDGSLVAVNRLDPQIGTWDVWIIDAATNVPSRLTSDRASESDAVWSADGKEVIYVSDRDGKLAFYRQAIAGGSPQLVLDVSDARWAIPSDWSLDGQYLLYHRYDRNWSIWALPMFGDRRPVQLEEDQFAPAGSRLSPDGKWLAYSMFEAGKFEIFVKRFLGETPKKQLTHGGGVHPRWTKNGQELVYWAPPGVLANDITLTESDIGVGPTRTLFDRPVMILIDARPHYDITRDGQRLLVRQPAGPQAPGVRVIVNWMAKIAR